jgi:dUTP pyrophosphatase
MSRYVRIQRIDPNAKIPIYGSEGAAAFDLYACEEVTLEPGKRATVRTGLKMAAPKGYHIKICVRSGLAAKHGLQVLNGPGIIDSDYRGEVMVILHNAGEKPYEVKIGDRIAQGLLEENTGAIFMEADLSPTERGEGGFGSTGR